MNYVFIQKESGRVRCEAVVQAVKAIQAKLCQIETVDMDKAIKRLRAASQPPPVSFLLTSISTFFLPIFERLTSNLICIYAHIDVPKIITYMVLVIFFSKRFILF